MLPVSLKAFSPIPISGLHGVLLAKAGKLVFAADLKPSS
jgi:hypothetical protein